MTSLRRLLTPKFGIFNNLSNAGASDYDKSVRVSMSNSMGKTPTIFNTPMPFTMTF